jgi:outer membrane protein OmpA-like peptidoglycan-associated protein
MNIQRRLRTTCGLVAFSATFALLGATAGAQQTTVEGLIVGRDGPNMTVQTHDTPRLTVVLSDHTQAKEKGGFLGLGRKDLGITALVPGLPVKVEGTYDPDHKLLANKVEFGKRELKTAKQIDAGLNPIAQQVAAAQDNIRSNRKNIDQNQQDIASAKQDIDTNKQGIAANTQGNAENKQAIGQATQRFGQLDQYDTKGSYTVNFANGKAVVGRRYKQELAEFVKTAAATPGAMVEVQGYASAKGSPSLNQRLSAERADAVLSIIQQTGAVPLTNILAPAAMGTTNQVGSNHTRGGQAQNRRVVVTILVNKGIAGESPAGM